MTIAPLAAARTYGTLHYVVSEFEDGVASWIIKAEPDVVIRLKRIFPRLNPNARGYLVIKDTPEVARDLEWLNFRWPLDMEPDIAELLADRAERDRQNEKKIDAILGGYVERDGELTPMLTPFDYQWAPAEIVATTGGLLLGDDLGAGKTLEGLLVLRKPNSLPALCVVPVHLVRQWRDDIAEIYPTLRTHVIRKTAVYDPSKTREMRGHYPDVLICTYGKLHGWAEHLASEGKVKTVLFDEVQDVRRNGTRKYEAAERISHACRMKMGMTATPVYNYGAEAHNIINVLAPDVLGNRAEFIREWGTGKDQGDKTPVLDPAALGRYLRERGVFLRRTRADIKMHLPKMLRIPHLVDADKAILDDLMEGSVDLAELILDRGDRPQQDVWRASADLDWRVRRATGLAKAPYVVAFVKMLLESQQKVVVWAWHRDVYAVLLEGLRPFEPVLYTGSESAAQKYKMASRFIGGDRLKDLCRKNGFRVPESRVMLMSVRSGTGLNGLQKVCSTGVFAELDWAPGYHDQCIGRLDRIGQTEPVNAYFLHTDDGSDPVVMEALQIKRMQAEPIRDPDLPVFEQADSDADRIKRLAADILERRRSKVTA